MPHKPLLLCHILFGDFFLEFKIRIPRIVTFLGVGRCCSFIKKINKYSKTPFLFMRCNTQPIMARNRLTGSLVASVVQLLLLGKDKRMTATIIRTLNLIKHFSHAHCKREFFPINVFSNALTDNTIIFYRSVHHSVCLDGIVFNPPARIYVYLILR